MPNSNPLIELMLCRIRQFFREPEAIFWTYGFPLLMICGLGVAFRTKAPEALRVGVVDARHKRPMMIVTRPSHLCLVFTCSLPVHAGSPD